MSDVFCVRFPYSGTKSSLAQPSGLSLSADGSSLYVADSESSSVRVVNTSTGGVQSNVGGDPYFADNLFQVRGGCEQVTRVRVLSSHDMRIWT
jgi:YVTN family beta-propeller protein